MAIYLGACPWVDKSDDQGILIVFLKGLYMKIEFTLLGTSNYSVISSIDDPKIDVYSEEYNSSLGLIVDNIWFC